MGIVFVNDETLKGIADKIRDNLGVRTKYKPTDMPAAVDEVYKKGEEQWKTYWLNTGDHFELPEGMTEIPDRMFYRHSSLATIDVPYTVAKIGQEAFHSCKGLVAFPMRDNITEIGQYAFYLCENMDIDALPQNLVIVNAAAFAACRKARFNQLNDKVTTIAAYAFDGCWENNIRVIPASVTSISNGAFGSNRKIESMTILGKPTMTASVFNGCTNLTDIYCNFSKGEVANAPWGSNAVVHYDYFKNAGSIFTFPDGMIEIPANFMQGNTNLEEIFLPEGLTAIRPYAFQGCSNLEYVTFPNGLDIIEEFAFYQCPKLKVYDLPDSVTEIESAAFAGLKGVALSKLPDSLQKLETYCMQNCSGNTFKEIPEGVICISKLALGGNTGLTELTFKGTLPANGISSDALEGCTNLTDIYVPWSEGEVANAPWGCNATIHYNHKEV